MRGRLGCVALAVVAAFAVAAPAHAGSSGINALPREGDREEPREAGAGRLRRDGGTPREGKIEVYGTAKQIARLRRSQAARALVRDSKGRTARSARAQGTPWNREARAALAQAGRHPTAGASDAAYKVYRKYDAVPDDGHEQYTELYDRILSTVPEHCREGHDSAQTEWGRDIIAIQVTRTPTGADNGKPAVLYNAHAARARVARGRDLQAHAGATSRPVRQGPAGHAARRTRAPALVRLRVEPGRLRVHVHRGQPPLAQEPATTTTARPASTNSDGVDPNRNFPTDWGLDDEGSSPDFASETYRGPPPASEPETQAMIKPLERGRLRVPEERPHRGRADPLSAGLAAVHAVPPTTRSSPRLPVTTRTRPSPASTPTSAPSSTSPTATRRTPRTTARTSSPTRPRAPSRRTRRSPASSSRTWRARSTRSSAATSFIARPRASRPTTRRTRTRISATR